MVAVGITGLVFRRGSGQTEDAPVGESADYAAGAQDEGAGITGDAGAC